MASVLRSTEIHPHEFRFVLPSSTKVALRCLGWWWSCKDQNPKWLGFGFWSLRVSSGAKGCIPETVIRMDVSGIQPFAPLPPRPTEADSPCSQDRIQAIYSLESRLAFGAKGCIPLASQTPVKCTRAAKRSFWTISAWAGPLNLSNTT